MRSLLTQLENNEAVLLMYLANELPADDRQEVEEMITADANLSAELARLRQAYGALDAALGSGDRETRLPSGFAAARAIGDRVRAAAVVEAPSVDEVVEVSRRMPVWMYPLIGAACLGVGMLAWWRSASANFGKPIPVASYGYERDSFGGRYWGDRWTGTSAGMYFEADVRFDQELAYLDYLDESLHEPN